MGIGESNPVSRNEPLDIRGLEKISSGISFSHADSFTTDLPKGGEISRVVVDYDIVNGTMDVYVLKGDLE